MDLVAIAQIVFALTAAVTAASLLAAAFDRASRRVLVILAVAIGAMAVAAWVAFVLRAKLGKSTEFGQVRLPL